MDVEKVHVTHRLNSSGEFIDDLAAAAFTDIWYGFDHRVRCLHAGDVIRARLLEWWHGWSYGVRSDSSRLFDASLVDEYRAVVDNRTRNGTLPAADSVPRDRVSTR